MYTIIHQEKGQLIVYKQNLTVKNFLSKKILQVMKVKKIVREPPLVSREALMFTQNSCTFESQLIAQ